MTASLTFINPDTRASASPSKRAVGNGCGSDRGCLHVAVPRLRCTQHGSAGTAGVEEHAEELPENTEGGSNGDR